ncbi:5-formyltetrahydrofolate cyclo-ligase [Advenella sp. RU8]|uniref:5-formyltetrahydrofolate cyclo-ligase n=1 Tax=Advenella sp. RU8 TaxID=3399575 RepID=UPI003AAEA392
MNITRTARMNNQEIRKSLTASRQALAASTRKQYSDQIRQHFMTWFRQFIQTHPQPSCRIAGFWPIKEEPDLIPLLTELDQLGHEISLPCITALDSSLEFYRWTATTPLQPGKFNIPEPQLSEKSLPADIILVPTLGFTRDGHRIGYGKGYYDRTLAKLHEKGHAFIKIGIAWDEGEITVPYLPEPHDIPLDHILTPSGLHTPTK